MTTKDTSVTTAFSRPTPISSVCSTNSLTSSEMRWSGLSAASPCKLHAVVVGVVQPFAEIARGHPAPPADLEPLVEIELIDGKRDGAGRQHAEDADLADEAVPVLVLQRIVEAVVPLVHQDVDADQRELDGDHGGEQDAAGPFVLGTEIREWRSAIRSRASSGCCSQITVSEGMASKA